LHFLKTWLSIPLTTTILQQEFCNGQLPVQDTNSVKTSGRLHD
jgi:hypothetical protein